MRWGGSVSEGGDRVEWVGCGKVILGGIVLSRLAEPARLLYSAGAPDQPSRLAPYHTSCHSHSSGDLSRHAFSSASDLSGRRGGVGRDGTGRSGMERVGRGGSCGQWLSRCGRGRL